jgi:hypothetical protein
MNDLEKGEADQKMMADLAEWAERADEITSLLLKQQPDLHPITAHIIAGDLISAERATKRVAAGEDALKVYVTVGSYARWDWVVTMVRAGKIGAQWFADNICDLWRGADPDDTSADYLNIWKIARSQHGAVVRDGRPLPKARADGTIKVYRGGDPFTVRKGFAWTTDPKIARKFADGAGTRVERRNGVVITGDVRPSHVLAYITGRNEAEVIVDPAYVKDIHPTGAGS